MKRVLIIGIVGMFVASCNNSGTQVEQEEVEKIEQEIESLENMDHELDAIKEEGDSLESLLNELED